MIYDLHTGNSLKVVKAKDISRTAFPIMLVEYKGNCSLGAISIGNTMDVWTAITKYALDGRISLAEHEELLREANRLGETVKHMGNGRFMEVA
jgi:hypothetical protein